MKRSLRIFSVPALLLAPLISWGSCSGFIVGINIPVSKVYAEAEIAYIGEVVSLRLLTEQPHHNSIATYEVTFQSRTSLKGKNPGSQTGTFRRLYYESLPVASGNDSDLSEYLASDGYRGFEFGRKYLILIKRSGSLGDIGVCDNRVVQLTSAVLEQLKGLAK